ncbi:hypothetical protein [Rubritalea tangerina]|uniref:Uncharacterized protein n=1 Tax=Rubritalea tangerina TaxID=430798 RepID=A0ABW4Z984_9BACT
MKTLVALAATAALLAVDSRADLVFSAPGMTSEDSFTTTEGSKTITLKDSETGQDIDYWKYVITGFEWALAAGTPLEGIVRNGGHLAHYDGSDLLGQSSIKVSVNGQEVVLASHNVYLDADNVSDYTGTISVVLETPIEVDGPVSLTFTLGEETNMTGDTNSFIKLNGYGLKTAPEVVGYVLATSSVADTTKQCDFSFMMKRLVVEDEAVEFTVVATEQATTSLDSGHGNNESDADGMRYDDDNKGAALTKWNEKKKLSDASYEDGTTGIDTTEGNKGRN